MGKALQQWKGEKPFISTKVGRLQSAFVVVLHLYVYIYFVVSYLTPKPARMVIEKYTWESPWRIFTKSWAKPATLRLENANQFSGGNYDPTERAYQISCLVNSKPANLDFMLEASENSPIENVCFVIKNWGNSPASLQIDGVAVPQGKTFRYGFRDTEEGTDLIVWVEKKSVKLLKMSINSLK